MSPYAGETMGRGTEERGAHKELAEQASELGQGRTATNLTAAIRGTDEEDNVKGSSAGRPGLRSWRALVCQFNAIESG